MDDLLIVLGSAAAAFTAGLLVAAAILLGYSGRLITRLKAPRRTLVDDEREHSPWRHM